LSAVHPTPSDWRALWPGLGARYRVLVPRPDVVELPGVGHYPQLEAPDAVLSAVLDFFSVRAPA
jgi:pimeloyl-ACP methyl ester carboxylesterase